MTKMDQSLIDKRDEMAVKHIQKWVIGQQSVCKDGFNAGFNACFSLLSAKLKTQTENIEHYIGRIESLEAALNEVVVLVNNGQYGNVEFVVDEALERKDG